MSPEARPRARPSGSPQNPAQRQPRSPHHPRALTQLVLAQRHLGHDGGHDEGEGFAVEVVERVAHEHGREDEGPVAPVAAARHPAALPGRCRPGRSARRPGPATTAARGARGSGSRATTTAPFRPRCPSRPPVPVPFPPPSADSGTGRRSAQAAPRCPPTPATA